MTGPERDVGPQRRTWAVAVAVFFTGLVFYPVAFAAKDSFPLSTYPMFAKPRGNPELVNLVALTHSGERVSVAPRFLGTSEVMQAKAELTRVARTNAKARKRYCENVAVRVGQVPELGWRELQLQRLRFDPIDYFQNGRKPLSTELLTTCSIKVNPTPSAGPREGEAR